MTPEEQAAADAAAAAAATKELGWRANLPEDLQKDPSLESFKDETEMIQMPINVAKSFIHTKKMVGADTIKIPKTDEEWNDVYNKLGRPEKDELYVLTTPEGISEDLKGVIGKDAEWFRKTAHKLGLSDTQATSLFQEFSKRASDTYVQRGTQRQDELLNTEIKLRTEFGATFDGKNILGDRALEKLGGETIVELFNSVGLNASPEFARFKFKLGSLMAEDLGLDKTTGALIASTDSLKEQLATLQAHKAYLDGTHAEHKSVLAKVTALTQKIHGIKPVPVTVASGAMPA